MNDPATESKLLNTWQRTGIFHRFTFVVLILLLVLLLGVLFFGWLKDFIIFGTFDFVVAKFVDATGMSIFLVKGILVIVLVPFFLALREIGKIPFFKRIGKLPKSAAWGIVVCYISAYFLAMYFATKDTYFHHTGNKVVATKYFAITPEGIRYFDTPGIDPKYGIPLRPATPEMVSTEERRKRGNIPKPMVFRSISDITFFDPLSGEPLVWVSQSSIGELTLFSSPGWDPTNKQELKPVTPQIVEAFKLQLQGAQAKKQTEEMRAQEAKKIAAMDSEKARVEAQEKGVRDKYVNPLVLKNPGRKGVAQLILGESDGVGGLQDSLSVALQEKGMESVQGLFKPEFMRDGSAAQFFGGDLTLAKRLRLDEKVDFVLLIRTGHKTVSASDVSEGLRTTTLNLEMKCVDVVNLRISDSRSVSVKGAGVSDSDALRASLRNAGGEIQKFVKSLGL